MATGSVSSAALPPGSVWRRWGWFVALGAALTLLGLIAAANLLLATLAATVMVGAAMLTGAILQLAHAFVVRRWTWALLWGLSAALYLVAASAVIYDPLLAAAFLTLWLAIALGASGAFRLFIALGEGRPGWGWMLFSALVSILAALVVGFGWPLNALWMPGLVLSIDLLFQGFALMLTGFGLRDARDRRKAR